MAFTEGSNEGALNGTTEVELVAAPAASTRRLVRSVSFYNRDTAAVTITLRYKVGATVRVLWSGPLQAGDLMVWDTVQVLDATNKSLAAVLSGAPAATNPDFTASWADAT